MKIILAVPRGFCAGVVRAIDSVERALEKYGAPVYVRHEIVYNRHVVKSLKAKGARFVEELSEVHLGAIVEYSARTAYPARLKTRRDRGRSRLSTRPVCSSQRCITRDGVMSRRADTGLRLATQATRKSRARSAKSMANCILSGKH